jgi:hypothetical protein
MNVKLVATLAGCAALLSLAGCRNSNTPDKLAFKSAIDDYFSAHQECVWPAPIKFPAQADTSREDQTKGFDALTDAGLLKRMSAEKKRFLIGSKQVNDYDLSDQGHATWTADATMPGFGNFCYGHREVTNIDSWAAKDDDGGNQYAVNFHYDVAALPAWASTVEMKTAFPIIASDASGQQSASATLSKTSNGWQVSGMPSSGIASLPQ